MNRKRLAITLAAVGLSASALAVPSAQAADGWVAVAGSVSREQLDWAYGPTQSTAMVRALDQCAELQRAGDCIVLASSPDCVAIVWDAGEPLNRPHGGVGNLPAVALASATAAAGPTANDPAVRCA